MSRNFIDWIQTPVADAQGKNPNRQGFYWVKTQDEAELIAEWREYDKKVGKRWYQHVGETPTDEKKPVLMAESVVAYGHAKKEDIDKALKRELTRAEKMDEAYEGYRRHRDIYPDFERSIPERRKLAVGDAIEYGALKDCVVEQLREDGRVVVFSYHDKKQVYGKEVDAGRKFMVGPWYSAVKLTGEPAPSKVKSPLIYDAFRTGSLSGMFSKVFNGLNDSPDYQRGYVWTYEDKQRLLDSLFQGRDIGRFIFVNNPYPEIDEILDGKQRLSTLLAFYLGELDYRGVYWDQISPRDRDRIEGRSVQYAELDARLFDREKLLEVFLEVNYAGVPQSEEHLEKVRHLLAEEKARKAKEAQ